jgi:anaerobic selenocysteine-containing dehydrogenase
MNTDDIYQIRTICPLFACPSYDGIVAMVENGRVTKINGDKDHPWTKGHICPKGRYEWQTLYHPKRFTQPLLKTFSGRKEISWEEAIEVAAERLGEVRTKFGPLSICTTLPLPSMAFFTRSLGSPNEMSNTDLCQGTCELADQLTYGDVLTIYRSSEDFLNSKCILLVGTNMPHSAGGQWQDVLYAKENGAKLIVVDPRRCESAEAADMYLQIRPGTDGALALAMLNVIINEGLYDADFVNDYCLGFDKLQEHIQKYTPDWAAEITWLSPDEIVEATRTYANNRPASYRGNLGLGQHSNSTQAARAFAALIAITGNIDVIGGNRLPEQPPAGLGIKGCRPYPVEAMERASVPREVEEQTLGADRFPLWAGPDSIMHIPHNPTVINAMLTGEPYPVKAWIIMYANPVLTYASAGRVIEAMKKLEFLMVLAYTPSPTSDLADLILPLAHQFEQNGVQFSSYGNWLSATPKLTEPPAGCCDDVQILHDIAEKMVRKGYIQKNFIPWKNGDEILEASFADSGLCYRTLCENGPIISEPNYKKYIKQGFRTPSGKVELYSSRMERYGYEPLPTYKECAESPVFPPRLAEKYPLYLTTRRCQEHYLSRSSAYEWVRKIIPYPRLHIHPSTAKERGIEEGDRVVIETPKGSIQHVAKLTESIHPQVVNGVFGWWLPERETLENGYLETNVNTIASYEPPYDPEIGINRLQGVQCQVHKLFNEGVSVKHTG